MSEEQAAPAEARSVSSGVEDTQTPPAPNQEQEPDAGNQEQPKEEAQKEPEKFSRQHRVYLKQQAELRKEREAIDAERAQVQEQQAKYKQYEQWEEQLARDNPWGYLHAKGYDLNKLQQLAIEYDNDPNLIAKNMADQIRKEQDEKWGAKFEELRKQQEEREAASLDAFNEQRRQQYYGHIDQVLDASGDKYELLRATGNGNERVFQVIFEVYNMTDGQTVLQPEQAADAIENTLIEDQIKGNKLFQTKKAKNFLLGSDGTDVVTTERKKSADQRDRSKTTQRASQRQSEPRTLSAKMASATTPGAAGKETFAERKERLARELAAGTWKPKAEYITPVSMNKH